MQKRRIKNLNSAAFLTFLLLPFFEPASLDYIAPTVDNIFDCWCLLSFMTIVVMYLLVRKSSKIIMAIIGYEVFLLVSTLFNSGDLWSFAVRCGTIIGFSMLTELCITQNCKVFFSVVFKIYFILISIHFIALLLFPSGIAVDKYYSANSYGFLGIDNSLAIYVTMPLMGMSCLFSAFRGKRFTLSALILIAMISAIMLISWSATGVMAWFILIAYMLFAYKKPFARFLNSYVLFLIFVIMQISIVFLRLQESFAFIIEDILGKSIDFTGRTNIWDQTFLIIAQSPIFGHGVYEGKGLVFTGHLYYYSHNAILEVLTQGGIVGLILYSIPFFIAAKKLYDHRKFFLAGIVSATLFSFLVVFLMEGSINSIWVFGYLVIGANISNVIDQYETYTSIQNKTGYFLSNQLCRPLV